MGFPAKDQGAESWPLAWEVLLQVADLGGTDSVSSFPLKRFF